MFLLRFCYKKLRFHGKNKNKNNSSGVIGLSVGSITACLIVSINLRFAKSKGALILEGSITVITCHCLLTVI